MQWFAVPEGAKPVLDYLVSIGLTSAVVGGCVSWLTQLFFAEKIKGRIKSEYDEKLETHKAQLKAQGDLEIEKLRSELEIAAAQTQFRFSKLHETRAEVIAEVYASLREAIICLSEYTKQFEPVGGPSREERRNNAVAAVNAFTKIYLAKQIFIPESAAKKLDEINQELKVSFAQFAYGVDMMRSEDLDHLKKWNEVREKVEKLSNTALRELERDFRSLLGDETPTSTSL